MVRTTPDPSREALAVESTLNRMELAQETASRQERYKKIALDHGAADRFGWGMININLRSYYGEGSKTVAFEIAEQLGWRLPSAVVAPMAGGSLVTKIRKGFAEFTAAGLVSGSGDCHRRSTASHLAWQPASGSRQ